MIDYIELTKAFLFALVAATIFGIWLKFMLLLFFPSKKEPEYKREDWLP